MRSALIPFADLHEPILDELRHSRQLEVVIIPVSDVDGAKSFYQNLGWRVDADLNISDSVRIVQVTPTGSNASIIFGKGVGDASPGLTERLLLVVKDIELARADLVARGVNVSEMNEYPRIGRALARNRRAS